ncbi:MAG: hypothetical protein QNJ29_14615 [Rhizobiaceae bacterium]|nr:hypothetical protein [Rhizobiaceae bacterium]
MKTRASKSRKALGILICLVPIFIVAIMSRIDGFDLRAFALDLIASDEGGEPRFAEVNATERSTGLSELTNLDDILLTVSRNDREVSLTEMDWIVRFSNAENLVGGSVDCRIPENQKERFQRLVRGSDASLAQSAGSLFDIGRILRKSRGQGCHRLAFEHFQKSAEAGYARAFAEIANAYKKGLGVEPNFILALENFEKSAELGFANSAYRLIELTEKGSGDIRGNPQKASAYLDRFLPLIERKIRSGDAVAARSLGRLYNNSNLLQLDPEKAVRFMQHAAKLGDAIAMHDLVFLLIQHRRDQIDRDDIYPLLLESSRLGYGAAFTAIGRLHLKGEFGFRESDAPSWFRAGVDAGHPGAMAELAALYLNGLHVVQDTGLAKDLALQGSRLNHTGSKRVLSEIVQKESEDLIGG